MGLATPDRTKLLAQLFLFAKVICLWSNKFRNLWIRSFIGASMAATAINGQKYTFALVSWFGMLVQQEKSCFEFIIHKCRSRNSTSLGLCILRLPADGDTYSWSVLMQSNRFMVEVRSSTEIFFFSLSRTNWAQGRKTYSTAWHGETYKSFESMFSAIELVIDN